MSTLNHTKREISAKIVYYGPGLSGKTTNLELIHQKINPDKRGKLISLETKTDRTLFFDFLPIEMGEIHGYKMRFHIYTVPGQVFYNETRKMVLRGVDGIVFVADSQRDLMEDNIVSLRNLEENLRGMKREVGQLPIVLQYNKRDLHSVSSIDEMNRLLNPRGLPYCESTAVLGDGVIATLTRIIRMVADSLLKSYRDLGTIPERADEPPCPPPLEVVKPFTSDRVQSPKVPDASEGREEVRFDEQDFETFEPSPASPDDRPDQPVDFEPSPSLEPSPSFEDETPKVTIAECGPTRKISSSQIEVPIIFECEDAATRIPLNLVISIGSPNEPGLSEHSPTPTFDPKEEDLPEIEILSEDDE